MCPICSHGLVNLTRLTSIKNKFKWAQVEKYAFDEIKWIVDRDTFLTYPDFNETFKIHTNASAFQLGAAINQKGKPIAFYIIKLTYAQQGYTLTDRELPSIV